MKFKPEDFQSHFTYFDGERAADIANARLTEMPDESLMVCGKYTVSQFEDHNKEKVLWISKEGGEGMGIGEKTLDEIWKRYF